MKKYLILSTFFIFSLNAFAACNLPRETTLDVIKKICPEEAQRIEDQNKQKSLLKNPKEVIVIQPMLFCCEWECVPRDRGQYCVCKRPSSKPCP